MKIEGKLHAKGDTQKISEKFSKREFVMEYVENPMYPQYVKFEFTQDRCSMLDQFQVGERVELDFNLKGREWTNPEGVKIYFNTLEAWRIKKAGAAETNPQVEKSAVFQGNSGSFTEEPEDLPF